MKKILHLISQDKFSGAENVAVQIINNMDKENYESVYCAPIGDNKKQLENRNVRYLKLDKFDYFNVKKAVEKFKPDVIHAHDIKASIIASLFYKKSKIISHIHGNHENMRRFTLKTFLYNLTTKKYDKIIWVSDSAKDSYYFNKNIQGDKSIVLYNTISAEDIIRKAKEDPNNYEFDVIYLGRIAYPKDPLRLIEIINIIKQKYTNIKVAIVGDGQDRKIVEEKIRELGLEENIVLFGNMLNPYKVLKSSKVMILTSIYEGTPMCVLEAIACNVPVVSTRVDGLIKIIKQGELGYLSNDNEELAEKIVYILENEKERKRLSKNIEKANKYINNMEKYIMTISEIYS